MSTTRRPPSTSCGIASADAWCGSAENATSTSGSSSCTMRSRSARCGNTVASGWPAAERPVTPTRRASGCRARMRAVSAPAYPVTLTIPTRTMTPSWHPRRRLRACEDTVKWICDYSDARPDAANPGGSFAGWYTPGATLVRRPLRVAKGTLEMFGLSRLSPVQLVVLLVIGVLVFGAPILRSLTDPLHFVSLILGLVVGITVHEASHATVAVLLGDPTPRMMGRVSLNPLRHLDPMGSIAMLIASFGWGKPVVFNPSRLHGDPRIGSALVAAAGPISNVVTALIGAMILERAGWSLFSMST